MIQFNLRIKPELREMIGKSAMENYRSDNGETIYRLQQSFKLDELVSVAKGDHTAFINTSMFDKTPRKIDVAARLNSLLSELHSMDEYADLNLAEFAYMIGMQTVSEVEMWFDARLEPSFVELMKIADTFGFNRDWLLWGHGKPQK